MIVRIWEAHVAPGRADAFCRQLEEEVLPQILATDGCLGGELMRAVVEGDHRVLMITRWEGEDALFAYAGRMWRIRPVWAEGELNYLEHPPKVAHYRPFP
ncbi:antibiotic biosynthesis monooxygenase [Kitasatospora sp. NPDC048540]|uniref:antibiotic biosynthesis monooxygenase family protein n=1 Tax=unclassified Kitasatospora TaxID=2633591 RepID=UPI00053B388E|nr:antibiotic biosynthesis monooxygenase [Kitasatospora sp. MBT63]